MQALSNPAIDRAILIICGGILAVGLIGKDFVVGDGIGARAADLAAKQPRKTLLLLKNVFLLVIDIEQVERANLQLEGFTPLLEHPLHHGWAKGIEKEGQAWSGRERELDGIRAIEFHPGLCAACLAPCGKIPACNANQRGVQFHAQDLAKGQFRGQQHSPAHACANVEKGKFFQQGSRPGALPALQQGVQYRRRHSVIGRCLPVVAMAAGEMPPGDKAAGSDAVFKIEGMRRITFADAQSGEFFPFSCRSLLAGLLLVCVLHAMTLTERGLARNNRTSPCRSWILLMCALC